MTFHDTLPRCGPTQPTIGLTVISGYGGSFALLRLPTTVPSLIISRTFRPVGCGDCPCPKAVRSDLQQTVGRSSPRATGDVHCEKVNARRVAIVAVTVLTVAVMVNAVAGIEPILRAVKGERECTGLNGKVFS